MGARAKGADVVATLPLLAAYLNTPFEPSPYVPVSRRFWNEVYLDLDQVPASLVSPAVAREREVAAASWRGDRSDLVDIAGVAATKRRVVEAMIDAFPILPEPLESELADYRARSGVTSYARFRAAVESAGSADWRQWPAAWARDGIPDLAVDPRVVRYHEVAQWLTDRQLHDVARHLRDGGTSLYLDLPVGGHPDGFDAWSNAGAYAPGVAVGAPPDAFFPLGQNWGIPPVLPTAGHADGYADLQRCLDHHLSVADVLRVDHAVGLHRSYWIPDGADAHEGLFVLAPSDELTAVISAASHRHGSAIVGEDLGTVPDEVRRLLADHDILGMHVGTFAVSDDPRRPLHLPSHRAVTSLSTHDLPSLPAWWAGADIDDRLDLGLIDEDTAVSARSDRAHQRGIVARAAGVDPDDLGLTAALAAQEMALGELATSGSPLVVAELESLWGEARPQNVPGTVHERPNWRRRAKVSIEELDTTPTVERAMRRITPRPGMSVAEDPVVSPLDLHLFHEGRHFRLYDTLGARMVPVGDNRVLHAAVWAPDADAVSVVGSFNGWDDTQAPLVPIPGSGIWSGFVPDGRPGDLYKFRIRSRHGRYVVDKADPMALLAELPPATASRVWDGGYDWGDREWMATRHGRQGPDRCMSVTEVHLGSWRRTSGDGEPRPLSYRETAPELIAHCLEMGFTHVELLPIMEHPFYASWGYQVTGFFSPTSRYGSPEDLMYLIDQLHQNGIGVILDWVPSHFPSDEHGPGYFDGTHLYEHADIRQRIHPEWKSLQFNYGRHEVRSFLISSAMFWLDRFHADGLRVDAVASMLYLDYGRQPGEWIPNRYGGRENLDAVRFLQELNTAVYGAFPDVMMIAEESTAWPGVTKPVHDGGLGFGYKWDLGWMHDTLDYLKREPVHRTWHHHELTFRSMYQNAEHYVLPLSHDEVVHGKGSLLGRMPGDDWQRFANVRLLLGYQFTVPGVPLLFMGEELAPWDEWNHDRSLHWHLADYPAHGGVKRWVAHLNAMRRESSGLWARDRDPGGFAWVDADDSDRSIYAYLRFAPGDGAHLLVALNATPTPRPGVPFGVPPGRWELVANSDAEAFGGSGHHVDPVVDAHGPGRSGQAASVTVTLPPLAAQVWRRQV